MGSSNGNGNGKLKKHWNLAEHGILWKTVLDHATKEFAEQARTLVSQLQNSVQPDDALQGLLLDRIAAAYLRKQLMLETEAAAREYFNIRNRQKNVLPHYSVEDKAVALKVLSDPLQLTWSANALRYEALLDQALHRDLILLQKLKESAVAQGGRSSSKALKSNGELIEGGELVS